MILGLGIDLCNIPRMMKAVRSEHFVRRVFHPEEIAYAYEKCEKNELARAARFASSFAAREAFSKASGVPMYKIAFSQSVYLKRSSKAPALIVAHSLDEAFEAGKKRAWVSLSHDGDYAAAVVVIEKIGPD